MGTLPTNTFEKLHQNIFKMLRPTVLYIALSQDDQGLFKLSEMAPNVLSLSSGGYGNIPIPLIKDTLDMQPITIPNLDSHVSINDGAHMGNTSINTASAADSPPLWHHYVGFYGNVRPALARSRLLKNFANAMKQTGMDQNKRVLHHYSGKEWVTKISTTLFNLAPRGFGRTSFRLAEILQIGRIPVYLYDDVPWLPYQGTDLSFDNFGYVAGTNEYQHVVKTLEAHSKNITEIKRRLLEIKKIRKHYTYEGVLAQLNLFFSDPFGENGGQFRCSRLPQKDH